MGAFRDGKSRFVAARWPAFWKAPGPSGGTGTATRPWSLTTSRTTVCPSWTCSASDWYPCG